MIRKLLAATGLALVGLVATPGAAYAYTPIEEPELELLIAPDDVVIGETEVPFESSEFLPGSSARFAVSAPGVASADIALTVIESGDGPGATASGAIDVAVAADGTFLVGVVFPEEADYLITSSGLNLDGTPRTVSLTLELNAGGGTVGGGNGNGGGNGGGGLPGTGFTSFGGLLAGAGLVGIGAGVIVMSRRRSHLVDTDA